jgi:uncharacterized repeat protein (TIGR01451 family)
MQASAREIPPGGRLTYSFIIPNTGTADASPATIINPLPASVAYVRGSATSGATYDANKHEMRWTGTVPANGEVTIAYSVDVLPPLADGDVISNRATIRDGVHPAMTRSVDVNVVAPDLSRSDMQVAPLVVAGTPLRYVVRVVNSGHAAADIRFSDVLPASVTYIESSAQASFGGVVSFDAATRTLKWDGTVPARSIVEISFAVQVTGNIATITNVATVTDSLGGTIELSATTRIVPYRIHMPLFFKNYP